MNTRVPKAISREWSKSSIRHQVELIRCYVEIYGRENSEQWIEFLLGKLNIYESKELGWQDERITAEELLVHSEGLETMTHSHEKRWQIF